MNHTIYLFIYEFNRINSTELSADKSRLNG